jgi:succinate-semialdehyde dehydrogenase/glutarate-semialdehyde dehydrogenase
VIASIDPTTGETLREFAPHDEREVDHRLSKAAAAFDRWHRTPVAERAAVLSAAADLLEREKDDVARLMTLEMGKTRKSAAEESAKCALACRYYAEHGPRFVTTERVLAEASQVGDVRYLPLGVVLAIMPWNFPFWQVIRFAAPALVAGNVGVLKHASNVPQCALALETLFRRAGAPDGVFQALLVGSDRVEALIGDPRVAAVTLTGSEGAGRAVGAAAGRALKKSVLELGGSDPFVVLPSADVARAAEVAVTARCINNGQSCIAAKRFIVHRDVADAFERELVRRMSALRIGNPMDDATELGPLATVQIARDLEQQVQQSVDRGARVLSGGKRMPGRGNFFEPTVLGDIPRGSPAYGEELFGPVAAVFRVSSTDEAIALANDSKFGLGAAVWTTDAAEAERCALELQAGSVFVNAMVASDPRFPFGGVKASGYGRELGIWGLREFVNIKTVRRFGATAGGVSDVE